MTATDRATSEWAAWRVPALLSVAVIVRLWVMPLQSSLWLDELGTAWTTSGRWSEVFERARLFPQSFPYSVIVWATRSALGSSEWALRAPSLAAMLAATYVVYRLARQLFDREIGLLSAGVFLLFRDVAFAAADARPYAFALLALTASSWMLVRWLDGGASGDAARYVLLAAAAVYFQYLFAAGLAAQAIYALIRVRSTRVSPRALASAGVALGCLLAPAVLLLRDLGGNAGIHAFGSLPGTGELSRALVPLPAVALLGAAAVVAATLRRVRGLSKTPAPPSSRLPFLLLWLGALLPPVILFAASRMSGVPVFASRYWSSALPSWAVLLGWSVSRLAPAGASRWTLAGALALLLATRGELTRWSIAHDGEDWRGAVDRANSLAGSLPVLLAGTFTESRDPDLVVDPRHAAYLLAPLDYYRTRGPARVLPLRADPRADGFLEALPDAGSLGRGFVLIERSSAFPSWEPLLAKRWAASGLVDRDVFTSPRLKVRLFQPPR